MSTGRGEPPQVSTLRPSARLIGIDLPPSAESPQTDSATLCAPSKDGSGVHTISVGSNTLLRVTFNRNPGTEDNLSVQEMTEELRFMPPSITLSCFSFRETGIVPFTVYSKRRRNGGPGVLHEDCYRVFLPLLSNGSDATSFKVVEDGLVLPDEDANGADWRELYIDGRGDTLPPPAPPAPSIPHRPGR